MRLADDIILEDDDGEVEAVACDGSETAEGPLGERGSSADAPREPI